MAINAKFNQLLEDNKGVHPFTGEKYRKKQGVWHSENECTYDFGTSPKEKGHRRKTFTEIHIFKLKDTIRGLMYRNGEKVAECYAPTLDVLRDRYPNAVLIQNGGRI